MDSENNGPQVLEGIQKAAKLKATYRCTECNRRFVFPSMLLDHLKFHISGPYKCDGCGSCYSSRYSLNYHKKHTCIELQRRGSIDSSQFRDSERALQCSFCPKKFELAGSLSRHVIKTHRTSEVLACTVCEKEFVSASALEEHVWTHVGSDNGVANTVLVERDKKKGKHISALRRNPQESFLPAPNLKKKHRYPISLKGFRKKFKLKGLQECTTAPPKSNKTSKTSQQFPCDVCPRGYSTKFGLYFHSQVHMKGGQYCCHICHQFFKFKLSLKSHLSLFHAPGRNSSLCEEELRKDFHRVAKDDRSVEPSLVCHLCHRKCKDPRGLKIHITLFHVEDSDRLLARPSARKKTHSNFTRRRDKSKPELSTMFQKAFRADDWVDRKFPCHLCPWKFKSKFHLRDHLFSLHSEAERQPSS